MGQPAARATDMQVCPMVTGIVPHVGGPITLGAPTVLASGLPLARVADMHQCVGPPGVMALGAFTVLVAGQPAVAHGRRDRAWRRGGGRLPDGADRMSRR